MNILFLIFLFVVSQEKNLRYLTGEFKIPIEYSKINQPLIKVCIGTPEKCYLFKLVTNANFCFIFNKDYKKGGFDIKQSSTLEVIAEENIKKYKDYILNGLKVKDTFYIESIKNAKLDSFTFYLINSGDFNENEPYIGILGLGTFKKNSEFSLLNHFENKSFISDTSFGIIDKYLYIGNFQEFKDKKYRIGNIIKTMGSNYELDLNCIIFYNYQKLENTKIYNRTQIVFFSPGANKIYCPKKFFSYIQNEIFKNYLNNKICKIEDFTHTTVITCNKKINNDFLGQIKFFFGKWNLVFNFNDLFLPINEEESQFEIVQIKNDDRWVFGFPFFDKFNVVFDSKNLLIKIKNK